MTTVVIWRKKIMEKANAFVFKTFASWEVAYNVDEDFWPLSLMMFEKQEQLSMVWNQKQLETNFI